MTKGGLFSAAIGLVVLGLSVLRGGEATSVAPPAAASLHPATRHIWAEGRLVSRPGSEVTIAPEIGGLIVNLPVREKAIVKKGDLVLELACDEHQAALAEAKARVAESDAEISKLEGERDRSVKLAAADLLSAKDLEKVERELEIAKARREVAVASLQHSLVLIAKTRLYSPIDGVVIGRYAQKGETALAGKRVTTIANLADAWVEAEIDEFDAVGLTVGAPVGIKAEGHATSWRGRVGEIPDVIVSRDLEREAPGEPQGTHVLVVKIELAAPLPLRLGQRVEVNIEINSEIAPVESEPAPVLAAPPAASSGVPTALTTALTPQLTTALTTAITKGMAAGTTAERPGILAFTSTALTIMSSLFTVFALFAFRRRSAPSLAGRRIVLLGDDGLMADQDVLLDRHETEHGKARIELGSGAVLFHAVPGQGVRARPDGVAMAIEGVPVCVPTVLVHGMVLTFETGAERAAYVFLERAPSHSEQERVWIELVASGAPDEASQPSFLFSEGDSVADVWSEDEIIVLDESFEDRSSLDESGEIELVASR